MSHILIQEPAGMALVRAGVSFKIIVRPEDDPAQYVAGKTFVRFTHEGTVTPCAPDDPECQGFILSRLADGQGGPLAPGALLMLYKPRQH